MRKIAVVTGASSGIGREISIELASRSYDLVVVARRRDLLEKLKYDLEDKYKINVYSLAHDLSNIEEINRLVEDIKRLDLSINVLVNNAGAGIYGPLHELNDEDVIRIINLNYVAPVLLTKRLIPDLSKNKGCIVNIISIASYLSIPWFEIYTSTKAALSNFTEALRVELRPLGIRVIGVYPGYVKTDFHRNTIATKSALNKRDMPRGPVLDPRYIAKIVADKIDDASFNKDIIPGRIYKVAYVLNKLFSPVVKYYIKRSFEKKLV